MDAILLDEKLYETFADRQRERIESNQADESISKSHKSNIKLNKNIYYAKSGDNVSLS